MTPLFEGSTGNKIRLSVFVAVMLLCVFLAIKAVAALMGLPYIGSGITPTDTIVVSGHGEAFQVPNIATFNFSIVSDKPTVNEAQQDATAKINAVSDYLVKAGIDKKDIQTSDYSVQPQYSYGPQPCPLGASGQMMVPCPPSQQVLKGYEVRQSTTVKVRDTTKAGGLLAGVGSQGATEVSGLTFTIDDPSATQQVARDKAIADARTKAQVLARALGVSLRRVVSFSENGNNPPVPMAYGIGAMKSAQSATAAPAISTGQNKVTDDVSVTYEIR